LVPDAADGCGDASVKPLGVLAEPKAPYFRALYRRLAAHKGKKRAIIAVSHALLVTGYILLWTENYPIQDEHES